MTKEETFIEIINKVRQTCSPERLQLLVKFLSHDRIKEGLLVAPASSSKSYHHCYEGGLLHHIYQVIKIGLRFQVNSSELINAQEFVTTAILHDIHKVCDHEGHSYYITNLLKSGKQSDAKPFKISDEYGDIAKYVSQHDDVVLNYFAENSNIKPTGHLSLMTLLHYSKDLYDDLTEDEKFAIVNHGGAYETSGYSLAGKETALQIVLHAADMLSSRYDDFDW
jgi:hypothetical protein